MYNLSLREMKRGHGLNYGLCINYLLLYNKLSQNLVTEKELS